MRNNKRGSLILITLIMMVALVVFVTVFLNTVVYTDRNAVYQINSLKALYFAEAGVNKAVWYLLHTAPDGTLDGSWRTSNYPAATGVNPTDPQNETLEDGSYSLWVQDSIGGILITAQGTFNGITRTVQETVILNVGPPNSVELVAGSWAEI